MTEPCNAQKRCRADNVPSSAELSRHTNAQLSRHRYIEAQREQLIGHCHSVAAAILTLQRVHRPGMRHVRSKLRIENSSRFHFINSPAHAC